MQNTTAVQDNVVSYDETQCMVTVVFTFKEFQKIKNKAEVLQKQVGDLVHDLVLQS